MLTTQAYPGLSTTRISQKEPAGSAREPTSKRSSAKYHAL